jgi:hypothetical protein
MMSAYIAQLKREADVCYRQTPIGSPGLMERFLAWYSALPEITRSRPFAMVEFEQALSTQGKCLSPILLELGWRRGRRWSSQGQYNRYWTPPHIKAPLGSD